MKQCKAKRHDGFGCGSYAFNLHKEGIDQGDFCDVHFWRERARELDKAVGDFLLTTNEAQNGAR